MSSHVGTLALSPRFRKASARETAILLALAWFVPFAVHLAPWSGARPLGAYLLPMFWTAFVAAYFYGVRTAVLVGLFAPVVNLLVTGLPAWKFLSVLSVELVVFAVIVTAAIRRLPRVWVIAPLGYVIAKVASTLLQAMTGIFGDIGAPLPFFSRSLVGAVCGLAVLTAINAALVRLYPKGK